MNGYVFDIKELAVMDGPGARVTVFLQGCPLDCLWCHNPEGRPFVSEHTLNGHPIRSGCACGRFSGECEEYSPEELTARLKRYLRFIDSDGGVTFSGGEPLSQSGFLFECADILRKMGVHLALETSGFTPEASFSRAIELFDLILFDIKSVDCERHKRFTGVGNETILNNLALLKASGRRFVARLPLIPSLNDRDEDLEAAAELLADCDRVSVELLAYNRFTGAKYKKAGLTYSPPFDEDGAVNGDTSLFERRGIPCVFLK